MMTLRTYLAETGTKQSDLAALVGVKPAHMSLMVNELRKPSRTIAVRIEAATSGRVPASSWDAASIREAS